MKLLNKQTLKILLLFPLITILLFTAAGCSPSVTVQKDEVKQMPSPEQQIRDFLKKAGFHSRAKADSVIVKEDAGEIEIRFSYETGFFPFRETTIDTLRKELSRIYHSEYQGYTFLLVCGNSLLEDLIPNYYRSSKEKYSRERIPPVAPALEQPVVKNISRPVSAEKGLYNRNILLWQSHGWYYSNDQQRWEWQRPRLFEAVEDLVPTSFVIPYLLPMLQNAGASVWMPRERSPQKHEVVVDNDEEHRHAKGNSLFIIEGKESRQISKAAPGFMMPTSELDTSDNPFDKGTHLRMPSNPNGTIAVSYIPDIPESGIYPVYISYAYDPAGCTDARYTVHHTGGETVFLVNQSAGGGTWIYLGDFHFEKGVHSSTGKVTLTNDSPAKGKQLSTDAVRFGGGMGVVKRNGQTSGMPKYIEGARYWLQYAGLPDTLVWSLNRNRRDYNDDYQSRAEYGNYLYGAPFGPNRDRGAKGLSVPMDLSLAFHTDAGITNDESIVGTLLIYTSNGLDSSAYFPDGVSRMANRDFADILQTQIVNDIRSGYDTLWTRRELRDANYSESARPNFPAALLELLSHQNFADMILFKDPGFRFTVSRAIYKGMLRFLSAQYDVPYVVQPLQVTHLSARLKDAGTALLSWKPASDPLERTAEPSGYIIYTAKDKSGFDNGKNVTTPFAELTVEAGVLYRFRVSAYNDGGESFPSEEMSIYSAPDSKGTALIVNAFDRVSGPMAVRTPGFAGFLSTIDPGVPEHYDLAFTGYQYDFNPASEYISNDRPGHGSSATDYEKHVKAGNTFDFISRHGLIYKSLGWSFVSASDESIESGDFQMKDYRFAELIFEREKKTKPPGRNILESKYSVMTPLLRDRLRAYLDAGGSLLLSGAYIGSDIHEAGKSDTTLPQFASSYLKWRWGAAFSQNSLLKPVSSGIYGDSATLSLSLNEKEPFMRLVSSDSYQAVQGGKTLLRYAGSDFGAAIGFKGNYKVLTLGFPLLSVEKESDRALIIKKFMEW